MAEKLEATPIYYHDCPVLGDKTVTPKAFMVDSTGEYILYYQNKCVFCSYVAPGTKEFAKGVTPDTLGGYFIDEKIAEKLQ